MDRFQIENLYKVNGLKDYKLKTTKDLLRCHGINFEAVKGYKGLDDVNKAIYEKFIVNIFNAMGLESRAALVPKGIFYVEDIEYLAKENPVDDYYVPVSREIIAIHKSGKKVVHRTWKDEDYKHLAIVANEKSEYLRFEYEHDGRVEWLHVTKEGKEWY